VCVFVCSPSVTDGDNKKLLRQPKGLSQDDWPLEPHARPRILLHGTERPAVMIVTTDCDGDDDYNDDPNLLRAMNRQLRRAAGSLLRTTSY